MIFGIGVASLVSILTGSVLAASGLPKQKIIEIAEAKASELGYKLYAMKVIYDERNEMMKKHFGRDELSEYNKQTKSWGFVKGHTPEEDRPKLKGRDYQGVFFGPLQWTRGGDVWVFIDRNTGEVIDVSRGR